MMYSLSRVMMLCPSDTNKKTKALTLVSAFVFWWAFGDSNPGPTGYEPGALTN